MNRLSAAWTPLDVDFHIRAVAAIGIIKVKDSIRLSCAPRRNVVMCIICVSGRERKNDSKTSQIYISILSCN